MYRRLDKICTRGHLSKPAQYNKQTTLNYETNRLFGRSRLTVFGGAVQADESQVLYDGILGANEIQQRRQTVLLGQRRA